MASKYLKKITMISQEAVPIECKELIAKAMGIDFWYVIDIEEYPQLDISIIDPYCLLRPILKPETGKLEMIRGGRKWEEIIHILVVTGAV